MRGMLVCIIALFFQINVVWAVPKVHPPHKTDVVIIGAGLTGLATAYHLKEASVPYHILELKPRVGGRTRTVRYYRWGEDIVAADAGMEEYWESNPGVKILKSFDLPIETYVASSSMTLQGKVYPLIGDEDPDGYHQRVFNVDEYTAYKRFRAFVRPLVEVLRANKRPLPVELLDLKDISFGSWLKKQALPLKVSEWIRVSIEPEIGTSIVAISAIDGIAELHMLIGDGVDEEQAVRVLGGNQLFIDALVTHIGQEHISINQRVTAVRSKGDTVRVTYRDQETSTAGSIEAKHLVSTVPLYRLFEIQFEPGLSDEKLQAIQSMTWGSYFKVHLFVRPSACGFWERKGGSMLPILSDSNLGVIYEADMAAKSNVRLLSLLVHGAYAEAFNRMQSQQVREEILASLEKLWPGFHEHYLDMEFYRFHPRALASWPVGRSRYDALSDAIRTPEHRVYLAGDHTESAHSDGAFISAERVVRQVVSTRRNEGEPGAQLSYEAAGQRCCHEHAVGDGALSLRF